MRDLLFFFGGVGITWLFFACLWVRLEIKHAKDKGEAFWDGCKQGYDKALHEHPEFKGKTW